MKSALRLRRQSDFARVRQYGKVQPCRALFISFCANRLLRNRYGIVVSGRLGMAVARNRAKRRLRAALTELHPRLKPGYDIVVVARRRAIAQPASELKRILNEVFLRAQLIETG